MFTGQRIQGGSTITQQLIKNLTGNNETTVRRKVLEIFEALEFERSHTKEETIEWYLNAIYWATAATASPPPLRSTLAKASASSPWPSAPL